MLARILKRGHGYNRSLRHETFNFLLARTASFIMPENTWLQWSHSHVVSLLQCLTHPGQNMEANTRGNWWRRCFLTGSFKNKRAKPKVVSIRFNWQVKLQPNLKETINKEMRGLTCCTSTFYLSTHPDTNVDVVGIDLRPKVFADPLLAEELFEELGAVFQVVSTDPPLPRFSVLDPRGVVTRAPLHPAWAASFGECMG